MRAKSGDEEKVLAQGAAGGNLEREVRTHPQVIAKWPASMPDGLRRPLVTYPVSRPLIPFGDLRSKQSRASLMQPATVTYLKGAMFGLAAVSIWAGWSAIPGGAPYILLAAAGLRFAPAHDQAALSPGFMPLFVALIAAIALGESVAATRRLGLILILVGALIIVVWHAAVWDTSRTFGHALFLSAAFLWACFTVVIRQANLDPLLATALVAVR